jgi:TPR repeat protein
VRRRRRAAFGGWSRSRRRRSATLFRALAQARADCTAAARDLPEAGRRAVTTWPRSRRRQGNTGRRPGSTNAAAEAGEVAALTRLGDYYNFGIRPIREDVPRAVELYEEAVAAGDPAAAATLAMMHRLGRGVPRDAERMIALMRQGADTRGTTSRSTGWRRPI